MRKQKIISAREIKTAEIDSISDKLTRAKTTAFADYRGLTVNQIAQLRSKIKEAGGEILITKNTLIKRALQKNGFPDVEKSNLEGPTAAIFAYDDEITPVKITADTAKTLTVPKFKFGFFGKKLLDASALNDLAKIPKREILNGQIVSTISSPLYGFVSILGANIRNLVSILDQVSKKTTIN